jgi:excisionase family DNA binding protein
MRSEGIAALKCAAKSGYIEAMSEKAITSHNGAAQAANSTSTSTPAIQPLQRKAYSIRETAELLGISYLSVYRLIQRGLLKASNALRKKMIPATEIDRFLKETLQAC